MNRTAPPSMTWPGLGYSLGWGEVGGAWRVFGYQMKSGSMNLDFNGPHIAAVFHR